MGAGRIARAAHLKKPLRGFFAAGAYGGGRCCSNPPATIPLICFYKTETPASGSDTGVLGGRGWITQAAHLKKPRRGFFAAGTDDGGRCCSNPPATIPLMCFYKTETPASGSDTGVLGGRGWIRTTEAEKQQIYSLSPLATREHAHILFAVIADCLYILSSEVAFVNYFFHGFSLFLSFSIFLRFTAIKSLPITAKDPKTFSVLRSFWSW